MKVKNVYLQSCIYNFCEHLQHFCDYCTCICGITVHFKHLAMVQRSAAICQLSHLHCRLLYVVITLAISSVHQSTSEQFPALDPNSRHVLLLQLLLMPDITLHCNNIFRRLCRIRRQILPKSFLRIVVQYFR